MIVDIDHISPIPGLCWKLMNFLGFVYRVSPITSAQRDFKDLSLFLDQCCFCFLTLCPCCIAFFKSAMSSLSLCFFHCPPHRFGCCLSPLWQAVGVELLCCLNSGSEAAQKHTLFKASGPFLSQLSVGPHS